MIALRWLTIALFALLVFDVLWGVVSRYWPGIVPSDWTEELGIYLLAWISLLGSALTYRDRGHLGGQARQEELDRLEAAHRGADHDQLHRRADHPSLR